MIERNPNELYEPLDADPFAGLPNLFLGAKVSAPDTAFYCSPDIVVNGSHRTSVLQWTAATIPAALTIDLAQPKEINSVRLWPSWDDKRLYRYCIESSLDAEAWSLLVDRRDNNRLATAQGETYFFAETTARFVRLTFTHASGGGRTSGHLVEIEGFRLASEIFAAYTSECGNWQDVPIGLNGAFGSVDVRYPRDEVPRELDSSTLWRARAWRGERVNAQVVLWTPEFLGQVRMSVLPLQNDRGEKLADDCVRTRFVRYVLAEDRVVPDVLDTARRLDLPSRSVRPVWITVDVPHDATPGVYRGRVTVEAEGGVSMPFDIEVDVLALGLPSPRDWKFHFDMWQNPFAVARYHHVELWSAEHWRLLGPVLRMFADMGGKCLTTTILYQPWGNQTYDIWETMIEWIRLPDGSWRYDYSIFDRYVEFGIECGAGRYVNCISMVPWTDRYRYFNAATGDYEDLVAKPGDAVYEDLWRSFLSDFVPHLRAKGWLGRVGIGTDERPYPLMKPMIDILREVAPELRVVVGGGGESEFAEAADDWCVGIGTPVDRDVMREREEAGRQTTFYVCCSPPKPNNFTFSPPAESTWMALHAAAQGFSGFCRWAFNSWVENPLHDTNHVSWPAGDCFLIYPGPRSSIRYESLRQGIQDYEKIHILRAKAAQCDGADVRQALSILDEALAQVTFTWDSTDEIPASEQVNRVEKALEELSRVLAFQS